MPIIGLDGVMGLPGYSGLVPNGMLAGGMTLARDLLTTGVVALDIADLKSKSTHPAAQPFTNLTVERLQPNVRAALAEMELLSGVTITNVTAGSRSAARMTVGATIDLVTLCAPHREEFSQQLETVLSYADLRAERSGEILSQVVPQTAYWSSIAGLAPERHRYTLELLGIGLRFAMMVIMKFKLLLNCPRPVEFNALVQPLILTPGYSAFPSGHATEAYFAAELLSALDSTRDGSVKLLSEASDLIGDPPNPQQRLRPSSGYRPQSSLRGQLHRMAYRIAENRVVAGLHFPVDSLAGQLLGTVLARYFVACCANASPPGTSQFKPEGVQVWNGASMLAGAGLGRAAQPTLDVTLDKGFMSWPGTVTPDTPPAPTPTAVGHKPTAPVLATLWAKAKPEWVLA